MSRRQRRYSRVHTRSLVAHVHLDGKLVGGGPVDNISMGGLLVRTAQQLPDGTAVQLDLVRPGMKRPFRLPGWVVGASGAPPGLRIRFDPAAESAATRLHALLNELGLRELMEEAPPLLPTQPAPPLDAQPEPPPPASAPRPPEPPLPAPVLAVHGPPAPPEWARTQQLQLLALQETLHLARAQLERHERELAALRAELPARPRLPV